MEEVNNEKAPRGGLSFRTVTLMVKNHWVWFAMSIAVWMTLGAVFAFTRQPKYTRTAQILIKDNETGGKADISDLVGLDVLSQNSNIYNELAVIQSPDLIETVVNKLELYKSYAQVKPFSKKVLYGKKRPITIDVDSVTGNLGVGFICKIEDPDNFTLSNFKFNKKKYKTKVKGTFGVAVNTPVGYVVVNKTDSFPSAKLPMEIKFHQEDTYTSALSFVSLIKSRVKDQKSSIIELSYTDASIQRADDILNTLIGAYNENWLEDRSEVAVNTAKFINARLREIEGQLDNVDSDISSFKSSNLLPDLNQSSSKYLDQATKANEALLDLNNRLYMARYVSDHLQNLSPEETVPVNTGFESAALAQQIATYNQKVLERNNLVSVSSATNPAVIDMDRALTSMRRSVKASVDAEIAGLQKQISSQEKFQGEAERKISSNPKQAKYLLSVERRQKVIESLYLYLLQKREENEFSNTFRATNARVIKAPNGSRIPTSPKKRILLLGAFIMGFAMPFGFFYIRERMNTTVRSRKDIDKLTMPIIGEIPSIAGSKSKSWIKRLPLVKKENEGHEVPQLIVAKDSRNAVNESFRILRTNLTMIMGKDTDHKVVAVTSFNAGSGKSFISVNLGQAFALKNRRVLVIDCDLRHGSSSTFVNSPRHGLVDYLTGVTDNASSLICKVANHPDLNVLPIGIIPPNPTELLENSRFETLIAQLRNEYDLIILDCPPIGIVADTQIVEQYADRTIFIVRAGLFRLEDIDELDRMYREGVLKNLAVVINDLPTTSGSYYGSSHYYYTKK